jgi:putative ABC transport system permease protein
MWRHDAAMAVRGLFHHRLYSFLNVMGMSVALASAMLILLFVKDQLSYDTWIPHTANLYRMEETLNMIGRPPMPLARSPFRVLTEMKAQIPQVSAVTHVDLTKVTIQASGGGQFLENATVVDPNFFRVIELPLVAGNPGRVLDNPASVVLSQSEARKYFGATNPVGRVLTIGGLGIGCKPFAATCLAKSRPFVVSGVLRNLPHNTQLVADIVVPNTYLSAKAQAASGAYGYVRLAPGANPDRVLAQVRSMQDRLFDPHKYGVDQSASDLEHQYLIPFRDVHLTDGRHGEMRPAGSRTTVYGFAVIALLIVLMASSNFVNLTTAAATLRAREIAVRKISGATRLQIFVQFLTEAVVTVTVALFIAIAVVEILLPVYDRFLGVALELHYWNDWRVAATLLSGGLAVGVLSGLYPALVLAGLRPAAALSGSAPHAGSTMLRSALVFGQFGVSIALAIAAIIVFRQIEFARTLSLGLDRYDLVVVRGSGALTPSAIEQFSRVVAAGPGVVGASLSNAVPFDPSNFANLLVYPPGGGSPITAKFVSTDPYFTTVYGIRVLAGRPFSPAFGKDAGETAGSRNVLINVAMAHRFGYSPQQALGKTLTEDKERFDVVGVVEDSLFDGLREPVQPMVFQDDPGASTFLSIRVRHGRIAQALPFIDRTWHWLAPGAALDRYFLSSAFGDLLAGDDRQGELLGIFDGIAVLIACLGLFGLVVFTAERRTREVGIRKVAGARTADIVRLMLWRISLPVLVANLIAWPVAYFYLHRWLQGYAYRIALDPLYFLAAGAGALMIAWATIYAHTLRLARTSPVHALRYE